MKVGNGDDLRSIKILDSFFSDTLVKNDVRVPIFERAIKGVAVKFLLAHPDGAFGKARAGAISQQARYRSFEGLQRLARACNEVRSKVPGWKSLESDIERCNSKDDWEAICELVVKIFAGLPIEIRLYEKSPSGPLYFFSDLLIAGRFWAGKTAAYLPWEHIIDTPIPNDLYDIMLGEFQAIWESAVTLDIALKSSQDDLQRSESRAGGPRDKAPYVFISCCEVDKGVVSDLEKRFKKYGARTYIFYSDLKAGETWSEALRTELRRCDALVAVVSNHSASASEWIRAEIGAAWIQGKLIAQANISFNGKILPGIMDMLWSNDVASDDGKDKFVADVLSRLNWTAATNQIKSGKVNDRA